MEHPAVAFDLADETRLEVRPIHPDDGPLILEAFAHLSPESRLSRFLTGIERLTPTQVQYLTDVDHDTHIAIGARIAGEPVAAARCIRLHDDPGSAEVAITVVDAWQGRGIGSLMLRLLNRLAHRAGVRRFVFTALATNESVLRLLEKAGAVWEPPNGPTVSGYADTRAHDLAGAGELEALVADARAEHAARADQGSR